jgi:flagellar biosynthesis chaperone FliJ
MLERAMRREQENDRELLERLCAYRRLYQMKSRYDSESGMSVAAVLAYGEALMRYTRTRGASLRQTA